MVADIEFLSIYSEMVLGTVAFMAIVATLRQTLGEALTAYQYVITRFFVDVGLVLVFISVAGLGIYSVYQDMDLAWKWMSWMCLGYYAFYVPHWLKMRLKVNEPPSITAIAVILSTAASSINLALAVFGVSNMELSTAVVLHMVVCLGSMVGVFLIFVGSFMHFEKGKS